MSNRLCIVPQGKRNDPGLASLIFGAMKYLYYSILKKGLGIMRSDNLHDEREYTLCYQELFYKINITPMIKVASISL